MSAAIAAVAMSLTIVWAISGYAYPEAPAAWFGEIAAKASAAFRS
jgi:hypothetical protein